MDDIDGARVRSCLNEPGRLTESSQIVPFFLWNKGGDGFGRGVNQSWNYGNNNIQKQKIQGMEYNYAYNGENSHKYMLLPMTKSFTGTTKVINTVNNDVRANVESLSGTTLVNYDNQEEGFTFLHITVGDLDNPISGTMYTRVGEITNWVSTPWDNTMDFIIKPTSTNYTGNLQILSTPFLFYFGLRPGKTAIDKFVKLFGDKDSFNSSGT